MAASSSQPGVACRPAAAYRSSLYCGVGQERGSRRATPKSKAVSVLSQKFVYKVFLMRKGLSQPRSGLTSLTNFWLRTLDGFFSILFEMNTLLVPPAKSLS
jgi:hypothetical protein